MSVPNTSLLVDIEETSWFALKILNILHFLFSFFPRKSDTGFFFPSYAHIPIFFLDANHIFLTVKPTCWFFLLEDQGFFYFWIISHPISPTMHVCAYTCIVLYYVIRTPYTRFYVIHPQMRYIVSVK